MATGVWVNPVVSDLCAIVEFRSASVIVKIVEEDTPIHPKIS